MSSILSEYESLQLKLPSFIILMQVGDFFETYNNNALVAGKLLNMKVFNKKIKQSLVPSCGFPKSKIHENIKRLISQNLRIAIATEKECERTAKKIRSITELATAGTYMKPDNIKHEEEQASNSFIITINPNQEGKFSIIGYDIFADKYIEVNNVEFPFLVSEIKKLTPAEIILNLNICATIKETLERHFAEKIFYLEDGKGSEALKKYINYIDSSISVNLNDKQCDSEQHCFVDSATYEAVMPSENKNNSLYSLFKNHVKSAIGTRKILNNIRSPYCSIQHIKKRLDIVTELSSTNLDFCRTIDKINDMEKSIVQIKNHKSSILSLHRLFRSLTYSMQLLSETPCVIKNYIFSQDQSIQGIKSLFHKLNTIFIFDVIEPKISHEPKVYIQKNFNSSLCYKIEKLETIKEELKGIVAKFKSASNCNDVSIEFYPIAGFIIEAKKIKNIPETYTLRSKKGSLSCFTSENLQKISFQYKSACESVLLEQTNQIHKINSIIRPYFAQIMYLSDAISELDVCQCFANLANKNQYTRPTFSDQVDIKNSLHPMLMATSKQKVIDNDYSFQEQNVSLITGSNMSGKSTYLKQIIALQIMAQIGSFVPASHYKTKLYQQILSRIGSKDDIYQNKSTFMFEMEEAAFIANNSNPSTLCVIDEIGRGTSHREGIAISAAIINEINNSGANIIISTHYHELFNFLNNKNNIQQLETEVIAENEENIIFSYKVKKKTTNSSHSHALYTAKKAGLNQKIINNAKDIIGAIKKS